MINKIWFALLCIGIVYGFAKATYQTATGAKPVQPEAVAAPIADGETQSDETPIVAMGKRLSDATLDGAKTAVDICIILIGVMTLWLGLMNVARDAGLIDAFARLLRPLMRWLFPGIPDGHPAQGAILMNLSANMIGLDNAATPMGLKAMTELQTLNPVKDTATNSMAMFLAINNSSVTLIPISIIAIREATGSSNPTKPIAGIIIATTISTLSAVLITKWLARRPAHKVAAEGPQPNDSDGGAPMADGEASNG